MIDNLPDGNNLLDDYEIFAGVDFIVTDLDGTLVNGKLPLLQQIKDSISKLRKKHTQFTVATGRTYHGSKDVMEQLGINGVIPVALYNGGIVVEFGTGKILFDSYLPCDLIEALLPLVNTEKNNIYIYTFDSAYPFFGDFGSAGIKEEVYAWGKKVKEKDVNGMHIQWMRDRNFVSEKVCAILIENNMQQEEKNTILSTLRQFPGVRVTDSGHGFIEIKGEGNDKGIIYDVLRNGQFSAKKILAIGDNDNDLELFKGADISVAVGNTSELAREYADFVCERDSAEGFFDMLRVVEYAKRYYVGKQ